MNSLSPQYLWGWLTLGPWDANIWDAQVPCIKWNIYTQPPASFESLDHWQQLNQHLKQHCERLRHCYTVQFREKWQEKNGMNRDEMSLQCFSSAVYWSVDVESRDTEGLLFIPHFSLVYIRTLHSLLQLSFCLNGTSFQCCVWKLAEVALVRTTPLFTYHLPT